eukprot:Nitzschia sp. Nitz4//scaffold12_size214221//131598//132830//NITZ4_001511-RA/size214221-processed-gene-0.166-mRNA-1//-1//CDS//3329535053//5637//frame0
MRVISIDSYPSSDRGESTLGSTMQSRTESQIKTDRRKSAYLFHWLKPKKSIVSTCEQSDVMEGRDDEDGDVPLKRSGDSIVTDLSSVSEYSEQSLVRNGTSLVSAQHKNQCFPCIMLTGSDFEDATLEGSYLVERLPEGFPQRSPEPVTERLPERHHLPMLFPKREASNRSYLTNTSDSILGKSVRVAKKNRIFAKAFASQRKALMDDDTAMDDETSVQYSEGIEVSTNACDGVCVWQSSSSPVPIEVVQFNSEKDESKRGPPILQDSSPASDNSPSLGSQNDTEHTSYLNNLLGGLVGMKKRCEHCQKVLSYSEARVKMYHPSDRENTKIYFHPKCREERAEIYHKKQKIQEEFMKVIARRRRNQALRTGLFCVTSPLHPSKRGIFARLFAIFRGCRSNKAVVSMNHVE